MKKLGFSSLISVVAIALLCLPVANAQQAKRKAKAASGKTQPKPSVKTAAAVAPPDKPVAEKQAAPPAVAAQQSKPVAEAEPTEEEMKEALINSMVKRGGQRMPDGSVGVNNALAGSSIKIEELEKLGCKPAAYGAGYFCTYSVTTSVSMYSNEGTAAGDRHANGVNALLRFFNGGRNSNTETATMRFIRGKGGWVASKD